MKMIKINVIAIACVMLFATGCANSQKMALLNDKDALSKSANPVFLMSVTVKNNYRPWYQPEIYHVQVERGADRIIFAMDEQAQIISATENNYLIRMELENAGYVLRGLIGRGGFASLGNFFIQLHLDLKSMGSGVSYLGHIDASIRERNDGEFRAGPLAPILWQAIPGFSGGTFDVAVSDAFIVDEEKFRSKFVGLKDIEIKKSILPAFDRQKAQEWWEEDLNGWPD